MSLGTASFQHPNARTLVFAKAPVPGACKTRLIPLLGAEGAAKLAEGLLRQTAERVAAARLSPVTLCCAPNTSHPVFHALAERLDLQLEDQSGADLGERMQTAATAALATTESVLVIGTDCPSLDVEYLRQALTALSKTSAVMGPADDGGYVLLGLGQGAAPSLPALFAPMPWGSDEVASLTRRRMRAAGLEWTELPSLADIDRPEDLPSVSQLLGAQH